MIEVNKLSFSYGRRLVLNELSFAAQKGAVTAVLGKNGAGKTTLFRCILGLNSGYSGEIRIDGCDARSMSAKDTAGLIAYIPQIHYPSFNYSVLDMVLMGTSRQVYAFSSPKKAQLESAIDAMQRVGIEQLADRDYCAISGGEQQLTLIARALAQNTRTLIMDEPTSSLDYGNQLRVLEQVKRLSRSGYTILLSIHNPQHALSFADSVIAVQNGRTLSQGNPKDVITGELISQLYGVSAQVEAVGKSRVIVPETAERNIK